MAHGVGSENPEPFTAVRSSGMDRPDNAPPRIEPQRGKVSQDNVKASGNKHWTVFHQHVSGSYLTDDAGHVCPQSRTLTPDARASTGR